MILEIKSHIFLLPAQSQHFLKSACKVLETSHTLYSDRDIEKSDHFST